MNTTEKQEVVELLKEKFTSYNNFYVTNTESLSVEKINALRRICFEKNVELKVAKNTLIKKALTSLNEERFSGVYDSLNGVTALMFSESAKEPALILSSFRSDNKGSLPELKAAFVDGDVFAGDNQIDMLKTMKSKNDLIADVIALLQAPATNVMSALNASGKIAGIVKALEEKAEA